MGIDQDVREQLAALHRHFGEPQVEKVLFTASAVRRAIDRAEQLGVVCYAAYVSD